MKHKPIHVVIAIISFVFLTIPVVVLDIIIKLLGLPVVLLTLPFSKIDTPPKWEWGGNPHKDLTYKGWQFERLPYPFHYIWGSDNLRRTR